MQNLRYLFCIRSNYITFMINQRTIYNKATKYCCKQIMYFKKLLTYFIYKNLLLYEHINF